MHTHSNVYVATIFVRKQKCYRNVMQVILYVGLYVFIFVSITLFDIIVCCIVIYF